MSPRALVGWIAVAAVALAVVAGLVLIGSPGAARATRMDERRVSDLGQISAAADLFWTRHERLPDSLEALGQEPGVALPAGDPETGEPYEFRIVTPGTYELCAVFHASSADSGRREGELFWEHGAGPQCFEVEASQIRR